MRIQPSKATEITGIITRLGSRKPNPVPWVNMSSPPWVDTKFSELFASKEYNSHHTNDGRVEDEVVRLWHQLKLSSASKVLELCSGPGSFCIEFAKRGASTVGVDIGPGAVNLAAVRAEEAGVRPKFILSDALELEYSDEFDAVYLVNGQASNFQPRQLSRLFEVVRRALVPGGRFIVEFPDADKAGEAVKEGSSWSIWKGEWSIFGMEDHLVLQETFYYPEHAASVERYYVVSPDGAMREVVTTTQFYHTQTIDCILTATGFETLELTCGIGSFRRAVAARSQSR